MVLSDTDMMLAVEEGSIAYERQKGEGIHYGPSSVDFHLGDYFLIPQAENGVVDVADRSTYPDYTRRDELRLNPGEFALGFTDEWVSISPKYKALVHGRSSVGRLGPFIHNAGLIDGGFEGQITLELTNPAPYAIDFEEGMRAGQLSFYKHDNAPSRGYSNQPGSKYQSQMGATPSKLWQDFE